MGFRVKGEKLQNEKLIRFSEIPCKTSDQTSILTLVLVYKICSEEISKCAFHLVFAEIVDPFQEVSPFHLFLFLTFLSFLSHQNKNQPCVLSAHNGCNENYVDPCHLCHIYQHAFHVRYVSFWYVY